MHQSNTCDIALPVACVAALTNVQQQLANMEADRIP